jgi:hypothetical protein
MSYTIPGCYTATGQPVVVASAADVIKPSQREEKANPSPARAQANLDAARRLQSPTQQPGVL